MHLISSAEMNFSGFHIPRAQNGINSINLTWYGYLRVILAKSSISSSLSPLIGTMFIFIGKSPAFSAASIPIRTELISPPLVISLYLSGLKESRLIFTLSRPASASSSAYCSRNTPFVVRLRSRMPSMFFINRIRRETFFLIRGSPPVIRIFLTPILTATFKTLTISS